MPALSEDVLRKLITPNAKALSSPKGDRMMSENRGGDYGYDPDPNNFNDDFGDDLYLSSTLDDETPTNLSSDYMTEAMAKKIRENTDYSNTTFTPENVKGSRLNSAILQEMVSHPIDTSGLNTQKLESARGNVSENMDRFSKMVAGAKMVDKRANELDGKSSGKRQVRESIGGGTGVDYALIKTIVNECLEQKLSEIIQKGALNEGATLKGIGLSGGNIKLVDNKGNVFQAKLEYKGNTKDKK